MAKLTILKDLYVFLRQQKKWWLVPLVSLLLLLGVMLMIAQSPAVTPFIYSLF